MLKLGVTGAFGKMGKIIIASADEDKSKFKICGLVEKPASEHIGKIVDGIKVSDDVKSIVSGIDVLIDFSTPEHSLENINICLSAKKPIVIGTTGLNDNFMKRAGEISKNIPVLISSNMSIGVNALHEILKKAVSCLVDYDIGIVEKHHRYKKDAPSGTALALANTIYAEIGKEKKIGIQSIRAGDIVGEHEVIFAANDEIITVSHVALSRKIFAVGALRAAAFISNREPKLYTMSEVLLTPA